MAIELDFEKFEANQHVTVWEGPTASGGVGVTDVNEPLADELNNTGGTSGMINVTEAISWNDWSFGTEASEVSSEPSMSDASTYEEFGQANYGGSISFYYPDAYDDPTDLLSNVYDLHDLPGSKQDIVVRVDGKIEDTTPAVDGDFVSVYRVQSESETNPFTPGESKRYTKSFIQKSEFSHFVVVGDHAITAIAPSTDPWEEGKVARLRASQKGRDVTNYLEFTSSDDTVVKIAKKGGFYTVTGSASDTATITITDPGTGDTQTVSVTVTA